MGGHAAGEIASRIAVDSISEFISTRRRRWTWPHRLRRAISPLDESLMAAVRMANTRVLEAMRKTRARGMGPRSWPARRHDTMCSLTSALAAYLIRDGSLFAHHQRSLVGIRAGAAGMLTEAEAEKHLCATHYSASRALSVNPDATEVECRSGDLYLLCSDGLLAWFGR